MPTLGIENFNGIMRVLSFIKLFACFPNSVQLHYSVMFH